jgi:hypothetical protein
MRSARQILAMDGTTGELNTGNMKRKMLTLTRIRIKTLYSPDEKSRISIGESLDEHGNTGNEFNGV